MQYLRHNFIHNITTSANTDMDAGWDVVINEINEIALSDKLKQQAVKLFNTHPTDSAFETSEAILKALKTEPKKYIPSFSDLVFMRHTQPAVNANGGLYDVSTKQVADAELLANIEKIINSSDYTIDQLQKKLATDLFAKQKQRNIPINALDKIKHIGPAKIAKYLVLTSVSIYFISLIYKNFKTPVSLTH